MIITKKQYFENLNRFSEKVINYEDNKFFKILYRTEENNKNAIIFIHGFNDNFYHFHISNFFLKKNFDIYAPSLKNYGRSCYDREKLYHIDDLKKYFTDIDNTILHIENLKKYEKIYIIGHSTGGITSTLYCHEGKYKNKISGLILNSPFFSFYDDSYINYFLHYVVYYIGKYFPNICIRKENKNSINSYSVFIYNKFHVEENCKLLHNAPIFSGWIYTVIKNQQFISKNKLNIDIPVLILNSDKTYNNNFNYNIFQNEKYQIAKDIFKNNNFSKSFGENTEEYIIKNSDHDLFCSSRYIINLVLDKITDWLEKN